VKPDVYIGRTRYLKQSPCPRCRADLDGITPAGVGKLPTPLPKAGDFSVCIYCGAILCFDITFRLREATLDDLKILSEKQPDTLVVIRSMAATAENRARSARRKNYRHN
jgi:hypothetical protein